MAAITTTRSVRSDIHRPGVIVPSEYEFVGFWVNKWEYGADGLHVVASERQIVRQHMADTSGKWAAHSHGGSCMVCGANAIYLAVFYHAPSNEYIRTGMDCAEKLDMQDTDRFRRIKDTVLAAQKSRAGLKKAEGVLAGRDLGRVWDLYTTCTRPTKDTLEGQLRAAGLQGDDVARMALRDLWLEQGLDPDAQADPLQYEERTLCDIVAKLVQYGSLSPKQMNYLGVLAGKIGSRPQTNARKAEQKAKWDAEKANVPDVPEGRITVQGTVLKVEWKGQDDYYRGQSEFGRFVMTVKTDAGWVAWGTVPASCVTVYTDGQPRATTSEADRERPSREIQKGDRVELTATFSRSEKDPKFAFFKRPYGKVLSAS